MAIFFRIVVVVVKKNFNEKNQFLLNESIDGVSVEFSNRRANLTGFKAKRLSRLNIYARGIGQLVLEHVAEIENLIKGTA